METLGYLLALISFVWLWDTKLRDSLLMKDIVNYNTVIGREYRNDFCRQLDIRPINCATCLTGWISIILFFCTLNIFFLSLPILYKILTK